MINQNENVYVVFCDNTIISVYDSKEKAFNRLPKNSEVIEVTQAVRTHDGYEQITPRVDNFYMDVPIYVHIKEHHDDILGIRIDVEEDNLVYMIQEHKVK